MPWKSGIKTMRHLTTLTLIYIKTGRMKDAVKWETDAIKIAGDTASKRVFTETLDKMRTVFQHGNKYNTKTNAGVYFGSYFSVGYINCVAQKSLR